jgi:hypothetical protein
MTSPNPIKIELTRHNLLKDRLLREVPDIDDDTLRDTLEGISNLPEMIAEVVRGALIDEAMAAGLKQRLGELRARLERLEHRAQRKRELASEVMGEAEIRKLAEPDFTVTLRPSQPGLVVVSEEDIPEAFWKPQPKKLDRQLLLATVKGGTPIPGVVLGNSKTTLTVRTK